MFSASAIPFARLIVASMKFGPTAVSWDRMKPSAPSRQAVVISVKDYLSGIALLTMHSNTYD